MVFNPEGVPGPGQARGWQEPLGKARASEGVSAEHRHQLESHSPRRVAAAASHAQGSGTVT